MAVLPVITNTYRVTLNWQNPSQGGTAKNIFHMFASGGAVLESAVNTCINAHVTAAMWGLVAPTMFVQSLDVISLDGISASTNFATGGGAKWTGGGTGDPIPNGASIIKQTTAFRGRSHRGRLYLPAVPEGDQSNGTLTGSVVATVQTAWIAFVAACHADGTTPLDLCVASYKLATQAPVLAVSCEPTMATQRRRLTRLR